MIPSTIYRLEPQLLDVIQMALAKVNSHAKRYYSFDNKEHKVEIIIKAQDG